MVHYTQYAPQHTDSRTCGSRFPALPPTVDFVREHPEYVAQNNAMAFLSDNGGVDYNLCHCTSYLPSPRTQERFLIITIVAVWM